MIKGAHLLTVLRGGAPLYMWRIYAIEGYRTKSVCD